MSVPSATVSLEPLVKNKLVYLPMAPAIPGQPPRARLMPELTITNTSSTTLTATQMTITFPGGPLGGTRPINMAIQPASSFTWNLAKGADHFTFDLAGAPTTATVAVGFAGYSDPVVVTLPVGPHVGPDGIGAYRFPSRAADLELGEFWQANGCSHDPGNHQSFAYDLGVWGTQHGPDHTYSQLTTGGDPFALRAPNSAYRIWGKPVRAMAAGEVIEIVNDCPDNPAPLYPSDPADMADLLDGLRASYGSFPNGEAGNHVIVQHGDEIAVYAHLQKGSIDPGLIARKPRPGGLPSIPGSIVSPGQQLGRAGNSGRSSAPHLHIHSEQPPYSSGGPRPMIFTGAWTIDNDTIGGPGSHPADGDPAGAWTQLDATGIPAGNPSDAFDTDVFLLPSGTPRWPETVHRSVEENDYQALFDAIDGKGMSPAWINTHTIEKGPFYFYTFFNLVFRPKLGRDEPVFHGLDANQFTGLKATREGQGYHVKQLESYFSMRQGKQLFAGVFARYAGLPPRKPARTYHGKSATEHAQLANAWKAEGFVPANLSVISVKGTLSSTALWEYRPNTVFDLRDQLTSTTIGSVFDANYTAQRYLTYLKGYIHQGTTLYAGVWSSAGTDGKVRDDLRPSGFDTVLTQQRQRNHLLRGISGYQLDGDAAFAAIWEG